MHAALRYVTFAVTVAALAAALAAANWLPGIIEKGLVRSYASLDEVRHILHLRGILAPAYFPQHLLWPPARILAQNSPHAAVTMEIVDRERGETTLVISQSAAAPLHASKRLEIAHVRETLAFQLQGRDAILQVGVCGNGATCSRISWKEGALHIDAAMQSTPPELLRIADSMIP